ncbi:MAG: CPBP family glutamic-type intramembrane protease [Caulobacter sp.]|nr:CPBP family glutamic-type intramembrane protease [Caulobacter sp.]
MFRRLVLSFRTLPDHRGWTFAALVGLPTLVAMAAIGLSTGLYALGQGDFVALPLTILTVFFVPAIGEEAVFRGLMVPGRAEPANPARAIVLSTLLYVLWHPLEGFTFLPGARDLFSRPDFLFVTGLLGLACALTRWRTGSIWPAVLLHWAAVVVWKTWLGGPSLETLG